MHKDIGNIVIGEGLFPDEEEAQIVAGGVMAGQLGGEPEKALQDARFVIGDFVACAVLPPLANGSVAPPVGGAPRGGGGAYGGRMEYGGRGGMGMVMGMGGPRENGYGGAYRGRGGPRGGYGGGMGIGAGGVPNGEWRRGERVPEGPSGRGRGYGVGFGGGGRGRY